MNAVVWLYRGEIEKYHALLNEYAETIGTRDFTQGLEKLQKLAEELEATVKTALAEAPRKERKVIEKAYADEKAESDALIQTAKEAIWLYERFGEGEYRDIAGLCKIAAISEIAEKGYSLTPGAYVGVAPVEDDGVDFAQRMGEIHRELLDLQRESNELMETISGNWKEMGL